MKKAARISSTPRVVGFQDLDPETRARLHAVEALSDDHIDLSDPDAPEVRDWTGAVRGRFYKPVKKRKSLRIDADVSPFSRLKGPVIRPVSTMSCARPC